MAHGLIRSRYTKYSSKVIDMAISLFWDLKLEYLEFLISD